MLRGFSAEWEIFSIPFFSIKMFEYFNSNIFTGDIFLSPSRETFFSKYLYKTNSLRS